MKTRLFAILLIVMLLVTACGGDDDDSTPAPSGDNAASADSSSQGGPGSLNVSGAVEVNMDVRSVIWETYAGREGMTQLYLINMGGDAWVDVTFIMPADPQPGDFTLNSQSALFESEGSEAYVSFSYSPNGEPGSFRDFSEQINGTLTLTETGEALSGSFEFSATESESGESVNISGSFNDISLSEL